MLNVNVEQFNRVQWMSLFYYIIFSAFISFLVKLRKYVEVLCIELYVIKWDRALYVNYCKLLMLFSVYLQAVWLKPTCCAVLCLCSFRIKTAF